MTIEGEPRLPAEFLDRWAIRGHGAAMWHCLVDIDWRELRELRRSQLAYIARYARQDMLAWRQRPVTDLNEAVRSIGKLVARENEFNRMTEDG